jgi:A/G-specific adenine glycosylase
VETLRANLLDHYDQGRRDLPWRGETDPYRIWVSEVMLQQTRVDTVIPYYRRWIELFPSVGSLAGATRDEVLLAWQGMGYYRRAARLHEGARVVRERYEGDLPASYEALRGLPGVGEYTAGAVASIAFGEAVPAVDGNVRRVLARLFDRACPTAGWLREVAAALVHPERPGDWNQALMELGATVCTPRAPACAECPLERTCAARRAGTEEERPARPKRRDVPTATFATAVVVDEGGRVLLVRRPETGLLGGMWSFPERDVTAGTPVAEAAREAARDAGATLTDAAPSRALAEVRHRFTHLAARYRPMLLAGVGSDDENRRWMPLERRGGETALPTAQEKIAKAAEAALAYV